MARNDEKLEVYRKEQLHKEMMAFEVMRGVRRRVCGLRSGKRLRRLIARAAALQFGLQRIYILYFVLIIMKENRIHKVNTLVCQVITKYL